jgi:[ribosomal protein S5]-alanine N-acetyltransferase
MKHREQSIELQSERLTLKVLDPSYAPIVLDYVLRNSAFFQEWSPTADPAFYTLAFQRERLGADLALIDEERLLKLWLFKKEDRAFQTIVGEVVFQNIIRGAFQSCHLGYKIDQQQLDQGFMTEALRCSIRFVCGELKLHRIEANIMPRNVRSRRVVEKLGFIDEGLSQKYLKINGVWEDHIHYVMLNPAVE